MLLHAENEQRTLILEPRNNYTRDKTWCYWQHGATPFDEAISHRWHRWTISCNGQTHVSESATTPYVRVDSAKFYEIGQAAIAASDSVTLRLRDSATKVLPNKNGVSYTVRERHFKPAGCSIRGQRQFLRAYCYSTSSDGRSRQKSTYLILQP